MSEVVMLVAFYEVARDDDAVARWPAPLALLLATTLAAACASDEDRLRQRPEPAASAPPATAGTPSTTNREIEFGSRTRSFSVFRPASLPTDRPVPVVVVLHGGFGTGAGAARQGRWDAQAERGGFLAVYPDGINRSWNAGLCCGPPARSGTDDVGFVIEILDLLETEVDVDPGRVYATGISNGGMMAYRLACDAGDRLAAVAPVAAALTVDCAPSGPVSLLHIHGLADQNVPFEGGLPTRSFQPDPPEYAPVRTGLEVFVDADRCTGGADRQQDGRVTTERWNVCEEGTAVELITIADGGHSWPGGQRLSNVLDPPSDALDATAVIWEFFAAHPKRP